MIFELKHIFVSTAKPLIMVALAVMVDTILGITKACKNKNFTFTSSGMKKVVPKCVNYSALLILFAGIEWCFDIKFVLLSACIILTSIEVKSILENIKDIPDMYKLLKNILDTISKTVGGE